MSPSVLLAARRQFAPAFDGQRRLLAGSMGLALLATGVELLKPWPTKVLFDDVLVRSGEQATIAGLPPAVVVVAVAASVVALSAAGGALTMAATITTARVARAVIVRIRTELFEHLHRLGLAFHTSSQTGDLLVRLTGDVNLIRDALISSWLAIAERGALVAGMGAVLFVLDPALALCAVAPMPLLALRLSRSSRQLREQTRKQRRREGAATDFAVESLRQIRVVKAYAREGQAAREFGARVGAGEKASIKATRISARMGLMTELVTGLGLALVVGVGSLRVLGGSLTPGELIVATTYTRAMVKPIRKLSREGGRLSKATIATERVLELLRVEPETSGSVRPATTLRGDVSFWNVRSSYGNGTPALQGLSFEVRPGRLAVIEGPNGSGKSTALGVLLRLVPVDSGTVLVDGLPHNWYELDAYRDGFAYVPQEIHLFAATVRDNIRYGRPDATDDEVVAAARAAHLHEVVDRFPDGYDTVVGEGGATLSGGQARRLMLARAALRDAGIVLLDEPLAGLDPAARGRVAAAIRSVAAGRTTIVVNHGTHDDLRPDVVIHLADGRTEPADTGDRTDPAGPVDRTGAELARRPAS